MSQAAGTIVQLVPVHMKVGQVTGMRTRELTDGELHELGGNTQTGRLCARRAQTSRTRIVSDTPFRASSRSVGDERMQPNDPRLIILKVRTAGPGVLSRSAPDAEPSPPSPWGATTAAPSRGLW
jgi:hypothetical protein